MSINLSKFLVTKPISYNIIHTCLLEVKLPYDPVGSIITQTVTSFPFPSNGWLCWKCNIPLTPPVRLSVGRLVGRSVCDNFLKGREVTLPCFKRSISFIPIIIPSFSLVFIQLKPEIHETNLIKFQ